MGRSCPECVGVVCWGSRGVGIFMGKWRKIEAEAGKGHAEREVEAETADVTKRVKK